MIAGWRTQTLGDLLKIQNGYAFASAQFGDKGMPLIRIRDLANGTTTETRYEGDYDERYVVRHGDLLVGMDGEFNCFEWIGEDALLNQRVCRLEAFSDQIDKKFVRYGIGKFLKDIEAVTSFATVKHISSKQILNIPFHFPSIVEQKRIVAILDEAFEGIAKATANAERNLANARELIAGSCHALISNVAPDAERVSLEALLERGWILSHLDGNHGSDYPRKEEFVPQGVPYISANTIDDDAVDMGAAKYLAPERAARIRKGVAQSGDVLFAHNATVGPVAILETSEPKIILGTSLTYYRCNPERIDNRYLAHYMRSRLFTSQYDQVMRQSTRNQVPITKQREFFHFIPPLEAQREISHRLDALEESSRTLRRLYAEKTDRCIELRQSLLHKAFSGQLTGNEAIAA